MLKKVNRLPIAGFREEKTFENQNIVLKLAKNQKTESRFGFIVSKKVDKRSSVRNKIKRSLRDLVQENIKSITNNTDILFIVKKNTDDIKGSAGDLLKKQGLIK